MYVNFIIHKTSVFSDNSGEDVRIRRSHAPGLFPQGVTEVVYTAYDGSGNSNNCTLKINVIRKYTNTSVHHHLIFTAHWNCLPTFLFKKK